MIEKLVSLRIPPGIVKNGTMFMRAGRWADGNLVRFMEDGTPRAIGGFSTLSTTAAAPGGVPRGAFAWVTGAFARVACGTHSKLYTIKQLTAAPHTLTDITGTPAHFSANTNPWVWQFDVLNGKLIALPYSGAGGGTPLSWDPAAGGNAAEIDVDAGTFLPHEGIVVTPEGFLVVLQVGIDRQQTVKWASQGTTNVWAPASTNSAGSIDLVTSGELLTGRRVRGRTLLWTTSDLWALNYVSAPLYYGSEFIAAGCGLSGPRAVAVVGDTAFWMGHQGFFQYNGQVQPLPCDIAEDIFPNLSTTHRVRTWTSVIPEFNEVRWFWTDTNSSNPNMVAIYNWMTGVWSRGVLARAAGTHGDVWALPASEKHPRTVPLYFDADAATIYEHEQATAISGAYLESGPLLVDNDGSEILRVQKVVPDNNQTVATENVTIFAGTWPKVAETNQVITIPTAGGEPLDVRIQGRYVRYKQELTRADSRIGVPRLGVVKDAKR